MISNHIPFDEYIGEKGLHHHIAKNYSGVTVQEMGIDFEREDYFWVITLQQIERMVNKGV